MLAVTPASGAETDLWIDPRTHFISKETVTVGIISVTSRFSDYRGRRNDDRADGGH
ncbi:MAG TPA: hypothetical protein VGN11_05645 [Candidatus Baltobacteraceae bacterium]|nr:hypothetical protein [Candidatus Baltobacteraceae bacterium]